MVTSLKIKKIINGFAAVFILLTCLFFTSVGHQSLLWLANKSTDGLEITLEQGRLLSGERIDITWQSETLAVTLTNFRPQLNWFTCATLCLDIVADKLDVKVTQQDPASKVEPEVNKDINEDNKHSLGLPLDLGLAQVEVKEFQFQQGALSVQISDIKSSASIIDNIVKLENTSISHIHIIDKQKKEITNQVLTELAALPEIILPPGLDIEVTRLGVNTFTFETATGSQVFTHFVVGSKFTSEQVEWQDLYFEHGPYIVRSFGVLNSDKLLGPFNSIRSVTTLTTTEDLMRLHLKGKLSALDIAVILQGKKSASLSGKVNFTKTNWPFELSASVYDLPFSYNIRGKNYYAEMDEAQIRLRGQANDYHLNLDVTADQKELTELSARVAGKGSLTAINEITGRLTASEGNAQITAKVDWLHGLEAKLQLAMDELPLFFIDDSSFLSGSMAVEATQVSSGWQIDIPDVDVDGSISQLPLALDASFKLNEQLFGEVDKFKLQLGKSYIELAGSLQKQLDLTGTLKVTHQQNELLPFDVNAHGKLNIAGPHHQPNINLTADIPYFQSDGVDLKGATLATHVDLSKQWQTDMQLKVNALSVAKQHFNQVQLDVTGDQQAHKLNIATEGDVQAELSLLGQFVNQVWQGKVSSGHINYQTHSATLNSQSEIKFADATQWQTGKLCGSLDQAPWCIEAKQVGEIGHFDGHINDFDLASIKAFLPKQLNLIGEASLESNLSWIKNKLTSLQAKAGIADIEIKHSDTSVPVEYIEVNLSGDEQKIAGNWQLSSTLIGLVSGQLAANVEDNRIHTPTASIKLDDLALQPLGDLANRFLPQPINIAGQVSTELLLSGDIKQPDIEGQIDLKEFAIAQSALPLSFVDSAVSVEFKGQSARLNGALNTDKQGQLDLKGILDWQQELSADISVSGKQVSITPQQGMIFSVSPKLSLAYRDAHLSLTGRVDIPQGRIKISQLPEQVVAVSDDQVIVDLPTDTQTNLPFNYILDLEVALQDDFRVYAFGLDSYVFGQISLDKTPDTPLLASGEFALREGVYKALGQDLLIQQGQVGFNGPLSRPYLNVRAIRNPEVTADDVIAGIELTGSASNPSLNIFSQPAMDQAHALSYLLNGQPLEQSENNNNALLSQMLLAQSINFSESFINKAGKKFGIEDVSVSAKGSGDDTQVELSGYITPSVQVSYRVGVFEAMNEIAIRYRVFTKLYIEATSGLYDSIDLLYQFDWDPE
ncbi:hypothetical protein CWB72_17280 [Pseudoalteromonas phenolica]|uniref:translocation/assembly module TamB domain-containing protein n=1 Tax=Pseudoalteromonas phenolica TaxID=161398 RepID=UPI00110ABB7A|nr:translocation/assembly module TamB domain-containing protein [Pseudoalteromonas phenolica]TMN87020.1 hypothetical protein CWB72_17280 [Pseudoalteromonas phenolica]